MPLTHPPHSPLCPNLAGFLGSGEAVVHLSRGLVAGFRFALPLPKLNLLIRCHQTAATPPSMSLRAIAVAKSALVASWVPPAGPACCPCAGLNVVSDLAG
jgi:hypothetical protein